MQLSDLQWNELDLVLAESLKGDVDGHPVDITVSVATPVILEASAYLRAAEIKDPAMDLLLSESDFFYVRAPFSVRPSDQWRVSLLSVKFILNNNRGVAVAWSMLPEKLESEQSMKVSAKLSPSLKFATVGISAGEVVAEEESVTYQPVIQAYDIGSSSPLWEFTPTPERELRGIQLLHLIIRQPKNSTTSGQIAIETEIRRAGGLVWRLFARGKNEVTKSLDFIVPARA